MEYIQIYVKENSKDEIAQLLWNKWNVAIVLKITLLGWGQ